MALGIIDALVFVIFIAAVVGVSLYAGRKERSSEDYFLAGRNLSWWLIGFSLIASNISSEHFVGMAGAGFGRQGMAVASWEWIAAISLTIVAWWLLPKFLRAGIYTMPEFLQYRYDEGTRLTMSIYLMVLTIIALLVSVLYSGAQGLNAVFGFPEMMQTQFGMEPEAAQFWATWLGAMVIGVIAAAYTVYGGLKAVVWSDLIQGGALVFGGFLALYFGLKLVGGGELVEGGGVTGGSLVEGWRSITENHGPAAGPGNNKLESLLPANDHELPWTAVIIGGIWIPNLFYWGLNQFITQRALGARSLAEGQKGIFLAAGMKLIMPFIIIIPGIIAYEKFGADLLETNSEAKAGELAYPYLVRQVMPPVLKGVMLAALAGAVMSTINSGINSTSTLFTIDIYRKARPGASPKDEVRVGRIATAIVALLAILMAPLPGLFAGVFSYIQEIWGFISPAIVACFFFGLLVKKAPPVVGRFSLWLGPILYACLRVPKWIMEGVFGYNRGGAEWNPTYQKAVQLADGTMVTEAAPLTGGIATIYRFLSWPFLHHMLIVLVVLVLIMTVVTVIKPLDKPRELPTGNLDVTPWRFQYPVGGLVILATIVMYLIF